MPDVSAGKLLRGRTGDAGIVPGRHLQHGQRERLQRVPGGYFQRGWRFELRSLSAGHLRRQHRFGFLHGVRAGKVQFRDWLRDLPDVRGGQFHQHFGSGRLFDLPHGADHGFHGSNGVRCKLRRTGRVLLPGADRHAATVSGGDVRLAGGRAELQPVSGGKLHGNHGEHGLLALPDRDVYGERGVECLHGMPGGTHQRRGGIDELRSAGIDAGLHGNGGILLPERDHHCGGVRTGHLLRRRRRDLLQDMRGGELQFPDRRHDLPGVSGGQLPADWRRDGVQRLSGR